MVAGVCRPCGPSAAWVPRLAFLWFLAKRRDRGQGAPFPCSLCGGDVLLWETVLTETQQCS